MGKGFSSEYLNLAKKHRIKMLGDTGHKRDYSMGGGIAGKQFRVKTEFTSSRLRYSKPQTSNMYELRPYSELVSDKNSQRSTMRGNMLSHFNQNRGTIYNDTFFRMKTEYDSYSPLVPSPKENIKL